MYSNTSFRLGRRRQQIIIFLSNWEKQCKIQHQVEVTPEILPEILLFSQLLQANISATSQLQFPGGRKSSSDLKYVEVLLHGANEPRCGCTNTWAWLAVLGGFAPASDPPDATVAWTQCTARTHPGGQAGSKSATQITKTKTVSQSSIWFKEHYSSVGNIIGVKASATDGGTSCDTWPRAWS